MVVQPSEIIKPVSAGVERRARLNAWNWPFIILRRFYAATSYVTTLSLGKGTVFGAHTETIGGLSKYLPAVGLLIGGLLALIWFLMLQAHVTDLLLGLSLTLAMLAITGCLHLDGLMDTADGICSHQNQQRMLEIMADSRVGNFGVIAGVSIILAKVTCLSSLTSSHMIMLPALILVPSWARWCEVYAIARFPYLRKQGKGKVWHDSTKYPKDLYVAALLPAGVTIGFLIGGFWQGIVIAMLAIMTGVIVSHWLKHKLGGHTGDTYGAVVELSEAGALLTITILASMLKI